MRTKALPWQLFSLVHVIFAYLDQGDRKASKMAKQENKAMGLQHKVKTHQ